MADIAALGITVGADVSGLQKGSSVAQKELAKIAVAANKLDSSLGKGLVKGSNQAGFALTNLGRVAQDAPFGFIGIQNNLNPLLESFQRLRAEAGSNSAALKALGASLLGPAGIGIALSIVSALILKFPDALSSMTAEQLKANAAQKAYTEELGKAAASAATEVASMQSLLSIARDETQARTTRLNAVKELQKEYPGYLHNINLENINSVATTNAINDLTSAIGRKAKVQALDNLLTKENEKMYKLQKGNNDDLVDTFDALGASIKSFGSISGAAVKLGETGEKRRQAALKESAIAIFNLKNELLALTQAQTKAGDFSKLTAKVPNLKKPAKIPIDYYIKPIDATNTVLGSDFIKYIKKPISDLKIPLDFEIRGVDEHLLAGKIEPIRDAFLDLEKEIGGIVQNTAAGIATSIGESLGNALAGEKVDFFGSIFTVIADGLIQLGKAQIAYATSLIILKNAIKNPYLALAAGIAVIAAGTALKASLPKFDKGITDFKGGLAFVHQGEALVNMPPGTNVIPKNQVGGFANGGGGGFVVEHRLSGSELLLLIKRAEAARGRVG